MSTEMTRFLAPARPAFASTISSPEAPMRISIDIVVRLVVVLAIDVVYLKVVEIPGDDGLGTGLLAFATLILVSGVLGLVDGFRRPFGHFALAWVVTGVLYGVLAVLLHAALFPPIDWSVVGSDLAALAPFSAGLVIVPAILAGGFVVLLRSGSRTT